MNGIKSTVTEVSRASARQTGGTDWARLEKAVGTLQSQLTAAKQQASTVELTGLALQLQGAADALKVGSGFLTCPSTHELFLLGRPKTTCVPCAADIPTFKASPAACNCCRSCLNIKLCLPSALKCQLVCYLLASESGQFFKGVSFQKAPAVCLPAVQLCWCCNRAVSGSCCPPLLGTSYK